MRKTVRRVSTGIAGLDEVLEGGLIAQPAYLLRGAPGAAKTLIGLHFLVAWARHEKPLFIALDEPQDKVRQNAASVGLDLRRVHFLDLSPSSDFFAQVQAYDLFAPAEVERAPITHKVVECVRELKPKRVFVASMTHFRYFAPNEFEYRKQVLSFLRYAEKYSPRQAVLTRVIGVLKKRLSDFDHTLREFRITSQGVQKGSPIPNLRHKVGEGTTVRVFLPVVSSETGVAAEGEEAVPLRQLRILLVEDKPLVREVIREHLLRQGHTVETA